MVAALMHALQRGTSGRGAPRVCIAEHPDSLSDRCVNIVHVRRPEAAASASIARLLSVAGRGAVGGTVQVQRQDSAGQLAPLLRGLSDMELCNRIQCDVLQAASAIRVVRGVDAHVRAKLEVVETQSCPRWHADHVGVRLLVTYVGPGTWFIANEHVTRRRDPGTDDTRIIDVDERHALQAGPGDLLYLKGYAAPGLHGAGAVHRSPLVPDADAPRLVLTVDDACCC